MFVLHLVEKWCKLHLLAISLVCFNLTGLTGLEPATSAVTGRCSNQLNYSPLTRTSTIMPALFLIVKWFEKIFFESVF